EKHALAMAANRFHELIADMPLEDNAVIRKHGVRGLVTLAPIVEKEAAARREQRRIAGVFHNRLRKGWSLGADPTVRFAVRKMTATLRRDDLAINSPYNTRRFRGLPPGPICSPGEDALRATLNPEKTTMMFFVAKDDGSREHFFTETYAEHNRYKDIAAGNRARQRTLAVAGGAPATEGADTLAPGARQDKTVAGPDLETAPTPAGASKLREPALQEGKPVRGRDQRIVETP